MLISSIVGLITDSIWLEHAESVDQDSSDSESRGQEEAGHMRQMSELFTCITVLKFVNTLNKPSLKLSLIVIMYDETRMSSPCEYPTFDTQNYHKVT